MGTQKKSSGSKPAQQGIPEHEIKQNSGVSASMALQAGQKAWDLRQAANAAGDPNAREEILAKAINKEIEAESFGKAAKYTQSGAFQGLAAGAGLGVQPGVTLGKVTGAIVGGTVSTVTGLLGGGIGSVYGAMSGPMWDLGEMASHGVRGVVGDFPNWNSTPAQKKALEKMVMQTKDTQAPNEQELEKMKAEAPDDMPQSWSQSAKDMTSWRPSMPDVPSMSQVGTAVGLGGLGASMGLGGQGSNKGDNNKGDNNKGNNKAPQSSASQPKQQKQPRSKQNVEAQKQPTASGKDQPSRQAEPKQAGPKQATTPKQVPRTNGASNEKTSLEPKATPKETPKSKGNSPSKNSASASPAPTSMKQSPKESTRKSSVDKPVSKSQVAGNSTAPSQTRQASPLENKENKPPVTASAERRKPRKLATKSSETQSKEAPPAKRKPRKLASRKPTT